MDHRHASAQSRPLPPPRAVSNPYALQQALRRPQLPSRLSNVRSVSQPSHQNVVDLTGDLPRAADARNSAAFAHNDKLYRSPDVINVDDDGESGRPAKRAKTSGHGLRGGDGGDAASGNSIDTAHRKLPGAPLPSLRKPSASAANKALPQRSRRVVVDRAARRANGVEPPAIATRLPAPRNVADFSPWTGHHPEDILSETVVKAGYFDKPPGPNSTESNSAKPAIWPNLSQKNNMGLQTLSYLFTSVMEKRLAMGKCTAPSTFKPPPRVTVTDTKREAWLKDLANPEVPLRKQSRTIPHGIRGKVLMEQCLGKDIPMPRAVWLAKCVGANELRAFRRKGVSGANTVSGEQKWIRDWTINIEQFLEGVIATCGQPDWQAKMDYAVKLATAFYSERLLERDHYLDWIVASLAESPAQRLPVWIILVQLYWKDITAFGRRGRQLAEAILAKLHACGNGSLKLNDSLKERLKKLVVILAVTNRGCLVLPRTWEKYRHLLEPKALPGNAASLETPAQNVMRRNKRLTGPLLKTPQNTRCALLDLYSTLDSIGLHFDIQAVTSICTGKVSNTQQLIHALLDWSASVYRTGLGRIYLVAKVVQELHSRGNDIDTSILNYLTTADTRSILVENVHRVVAELTRAHCFSASRYLQRLMTSGALSSEESATLVTGLLTALPTDALSDNLLNTRQTLMSRLNQPPDEEAAMSRLISFVDPATGTISVPIAKLATQLETFSVSARLRFAREYSDRALAWVKSGGISVGCFCSLRDVLERCQDMHALAGVVEAATKLDDCALLATLCDTANLHAQSFAALARLQSIVEGLWTRYKTLRSQQPLDRSLILSLTVLMRRLPQLAASLQMLESDLAYCESQNSMAACSPASDNLVSMQASSLESDSDIDAVFASGNTMDEQLMQRVFSRIVQRAGKPGSSGTQFVSKVCSWLNQLRAVDATGFTQLVRKYIQACCQSMAESSAPARVVVALVASSCLPMNAVLEVARESKTPAAASLAVQLVACPIANENLSSVESFRFRARQRQCALENAEKVISLMGLALEDSRFPVDDKGMMELVLDYSVGPHAVSIAKLYSNTLQKSSTYLDNCFRLVEKVLGCGSDQNVSQSDARSMIALADPLSVVHRSAALALFSKKANNSDGEGGVSMQEAILEAISNGCEVWPQLLESVGPETIRGIYEWARDQVLNGVTGVDDSFHPDREQVDRYLDILDVAYHASNGDDNANIIASVTERLKGLEKLLANNEPQDLEDQTSKQYTASLQILLHLCTLYAVSPVTETEVLKQSRSNLLSTLCSFLRSEPLQSKQGLLEYIYDVASAISDTLPMETLSALAKTATARDPRLASLLGISPSPDAWLHLVSHPQPVGSQQQRVLLRQQQQQQQSQPASASARGPPNPNVNANGKFALRGESKIVPFPSRRWEIMGDATPAMGENDASLSLGLFGARRV